MKIIRTVLFLIVPCLIVNLQSGCQESQNKAQKPVPVETKQEVIKKTKPKSELEPKIPTTGPILEVENPVFELGTIGPNKKVTCEFKFKNTGTENLVIDKVLSTCQCTVPELKKMDYKPGESGTITVFYHSGTYEAAVQKHLHIVSNDQGKKGSRYELTIKGKVELKVQVEPKKLDLLLKEENAGLKSIKLKSKDGKPFAIKSFSSTQNVITADFDPTVEKTEFDLPLQVDTSKLRKNMNGTVKIILSHPETTQVDLTYLAPALYLLSPARLVIRDVEPEKIIEREIWVKSNYKEDVEIESITSTKGFMEVVKQDKQGKSVKLFVQITPPPQEGKTRRYLSDKLEIKLADGEKLDVTMSGWYVLKMP